MTNLATELPSPALVYVFSEPEGERGRVAYVPRRRRFYRLRRWINAFLPLGRKLQEIEWVTIANVALDGPFQLDETECVHFYLVDGVPVVYHISDDVAHASWPLVRHRAQQLGMPVLAPLRGPVIYDVRMLPAMERALEALMPYAPLLLRAEGEGGTVVILRAREDTYGETTEGAESPEEQEQGPDDGQVYRQARQGQV